MDPSLREFTAREKYSIHNTLNYIPLALINKAVIVDLINEISVVGTVESADGSMNIRLKDVVYIDRKNLQYDFDFIMIPARKIRQINIPSSIEITTELSSFFGKITKISYVRKDGRGNTLKVKRAMKKHKETLQEVTAPKEEK